MQTDIYKYFGESFKEKSIEKLASALLRMMAEGNICIHFAELTDDERDRCNYQLFLDDLTSLVEKNIVSQDEDGKAPFIYINDRLYLQRYFQYEYQIVNSIGSFVKFNKKSSLFKFCNMSNIPCTE